MKDENSVPTAQKMTDVSLSIFRSKFKKTRIQMIDYTRGFKSALIVPFVITQSKEFVCSSKLSLHFPMLPKAPVALGRHEISQFPRDVSPHVHSGEVHSGDAGLCGGISCFGSRTPLY